MRAGWAVVRRARMWPGIATPTLMAGTAGACFLVGSALVVLFTALAPDSSATAAVQYRNAAAAGVIGICVLAIGRRMTGWLFHLLVIVAIAQITLSVTAASGSVAVSLATLYVFVAAAAFFVAWPTALLYLALTIGCCLTALSVAPDVPWWTAIPTCVTTGAIGTVIAILGRNVAKAELDDATGVPNRRGFDRALTAEINRTATADSAPAVVLVWVERPPSATGDFDDRTGDAAMRHLIAAWGGLLSAGQVIARRSDNELALLLPTTTERQAYSFVQALHSQTAREFCAGVSAWHPGESASSVVERADTALRRARMIGRNRTMLESARLPSLAVQLDDALTAETVGVRYQPVVRLTDNDAVVGVEALLRWAPAFGPELPASEVVRVAEDNNLIGLLDLYVLRRACLDAQWMQQRAPGVRLTLGVNVSGLDLVQNDYVERVFDTLRVTGWSAEQLVVEVTESVLAVDRPASIDALLELRKRGVRIAIDDFGTGYSSLSRLGNMPTDLIKLDASFTSSISSASSAAPALLQAVAGLAEALGLPILAEGVETPHQAAVLRGMGCHMAQGYHFGRPQTRENVVETIAHAAVARREQRRGHR
ncbi:GGDEF-domain containing protein [Mycobacterium sp. smrl_JER01]